MKGAKLGFEDWENTLTIIGTVIGAGILGLPYVFNQLGYLNGLLLISFFSIIILLINLELVQVILQTNGKKQFVKLGEKYLGKTGKQFISITFFLGQIGALIAYILGTHYILYNLTNSILPTIAVITIINFTLLLKMKYFNDVESVLSILIILLITLISFTLIPTTNMSNLSTGLKKFTGIGVILFSLSGFTIIPEITWETNPKQKVAKMFKTSYSIIFIIYIIFITMFLASYGNNINEVATTNLPSSLGLLTATLTLVLLLSSYLSISRGLIKTFEFDYKIKKAPSYLLTITTPIILIFLGFNDFIEVLNYVGLLTGGGMLILIILMYEKSKTDKDKKSPLHFNIPKKINYTIIFLILLTVSLELFL